MPIDPPPEEEQGEQAATALKAIKLLPGSRSIEEGEQGWLTGLRASSVVEPRGWAMVAVGEPVALGLTVNLTKGMPCSSPWRLKWDIIFLDVRSELDYVTALSAKKLSFSEMPFPVVSPLPTELPENQDNHVFLLCAACSCVRVAHSPHAVTLVSLL